MSGALISVRLTPRSAKERIEARPDGTFAARVTAPPVEGKANDALCRLVAKAAGVPPSRVSIARGHQAREKVVRIDGADEATVRAAIGASFPPGRR
jgi:uncharacterized protein (TIGR00251 family)